MKFAVAFCLLLATAAIGQSQEIKFGEEHVLLPNGLGGGIQATPAVAFGKSKFLVAWQEGWHGKGGAARIFAARISPDGDQLDPAGIEVAPAKTGVQTLPRVAAAGEVFLVVWQDFRNGRDYDVLGARVAEDGQVLDAQPLKIGAGPRNQVLPDVSSDGENFLVVWQGLQDDETTYRGWAAGVSSRGEVGDPTETKMTPQPRVAWNGSHYLVASGGIGVFSGTVHAQRLNRDGQPVGKAEQALYGTKAADFSISYAGSQGWLIVSHRSRPDPWGWGGPGAMRAAFVNPDGAPTSEVKEPSGVNQRLPNWLDMGKEKREGATWPFGTSASAFGGKHSLVVWQRHHLAGEKMTTFTNSDLIAARVDGFRSLDPDGVPVAASAHDELSPALAGDGRGKFLLVYEQQREDGAAFVCLKVLSAN